jgi:hypothetical protein
MNMELPDGGEAPPSTMKSRIPDWAVALSLQYAKLLFLSAG